MRIVRSVSVVGLALGACAARPPAPVRSQGPADLRSTVASRPAPAHAEASPAPAATTHATVTLKGASSSAQFHDERACAGKPGEVCNRTTTGLADKRGLSLHVEEERARAVTTPRSSASTLGLSLSGLLGFADNVMISGMSIGGNARFLAGGQFPGTTGGSWFGVFAQPQASIGFTQIETKTPRTCIGSRCTGGTTEKDVSGALTVGVSAGLQYMHFGEQDTKTFQQSGWGLQAGLQAGSFVPLGEGKSSMTFGPSFGFTRPKYNPGTGAFEIGTFDLLILPSKDFFFIVFAASGNEG